MKKTNKENPITFFRKANEARQAKVKKSIKKAQDGMIIKESDLAKQYTNAPMVGAEPFSEYARKQRDISFTGPAPDAYKGSNNIAENNYYNDPRFSKAVEGTDAFYKKEVDAGTIYGKSGKGFMGRFNQASRDYLKANPKMNQIASGKKKGGPIKRKK